LRFIEKKSKDTIKYGKKWKKWEMEMSG